MKASSGRLLYELVFWGCVGAAAYYYRGLYSAVKVSIEPTLEAYTPVALFLIALALIFLLTYLREAIASTFIAMRQRMTGEQPLNFDKGNMASNIQRTAKRLERRGDYQAAGEAFESLELWREAALVYERGNVFGRAANAWKQADNISKAVELYEKDGNFEAAGDLCMEDGLKDRAAKNYRIAAEQCVGQNQLVAGAALFEKAEDHNRAGFIFEQAHKSDRALASFERGGNTEKVLELINKIHPGDFLRRGDEFTQLIQRSAEALVRAGHLEDAARIFEDCNLYTRAAEVHATDGAWTKAAELYLKADQPEMVEQVVAKIEDPASRADVGARLAVKKGDWAKAGELFESAGKNGHAIDAYKKSRDFEAAAKLYEAMGRYIMAGEMYSSSRKFSEAANSYAKAYDWRNAAECFEECGDIAQAVEAYANAGNYLKAGLLAIKMADHARAVEYLQRIPPGAPDYTVGTAFLATAFYYQSHYDMAYELFSRVMDDLPLNRETVPVYYAYALYLESNDPKTSLSLFRQILGVDVHHADVSDRVQKLERIVTSMSTGYGGRQNTPDHHVHQKLPSGEMPNAAENNASPAAAAGRTSNPRMEIPTVPAQRSQTTSSASTLRDMPVLDDRYQVQEEMEQYGRVADFLGKDNLTGSQVNIRMFPTPEDNDVREATRDLLKGAMQLRHDDINSLIDYGEAGSQTYAIAPHVNGQNLRQWIRTRGPLSVDETRQLFSHLLEALNYAHSQDICHLNLRPEMIITNPASESRATLTGFGVPVRQPRSQESLYLTIPDFNPQYLAPEQITGSDVDSRSDIYSIGLLLFFVLTGRTPFEVKRVTDTQEIARMQVQTSLPRPSNIRATLPTLVDDVFLKCVNKSPLSRYQTVSDLLADLQQFHTSPIH